MLVTPAVTPDSGLPLCCAIARSSLQRRERVAALKKPLILRVVNVGTDKIYSLLFYPLLLWYYPKSFAKYSGLACLLFNRF